MSVIMFPGRARRLAMKLRVVGLALLLFTTAWAGSPRLPEPALRSTPQAKADDAKAHFDRGVALVGKGDLDGAIAELREAIRLMPDDAEAHNNLGTTLGGKGDLDGAIAELRKAI